MTSNNDLAVRPLHLLTEEEPGGVDLPAAERAAHDLLVALGADLTDESLADTPARVARMYAELLTPRPFNATTFPNDGGYDELVVARGPDPWKGNTLEWFVPSPPPPHNFDVIPRIKSVEPMRDIRRRVEEATMGSRRDPDA